MNPFTVPSCLSSGCPLSVVLYAFLTDFQEWIRNYFAVSFMNKIILVGMYCLKSLFLFYFRHVLSCQTAWINNVPFSLLFVVKFSFA